jgi:hypothetical protein
MYVLHQNENMKIVSKGLVSLDDVGVIDLAQYPELSKQLFLHAVLINDRLEYLLQGIQRISLKISTSINYIKVPALNNLSELATPQTFPSLEELHVNRVLLCHLSMMLEEDWLVLGLLLL